MFTTIRTFTVMAGLHSDDINSCGETIMLLLVTDGGHYLDQYVDLVLFTTGIHHFFRVHTHWDSDTVDASVGINTSSVSFPDYSTKVILIQHLSDRNGCFDPLIGVLSGLS